MFLTYEGRNLVFEVLFWIYHGEVHFYIVQYLLSSITLPSLLLLHRTHSLLSLELSWSLTAPRTCHPWFGSRNWRYGNYIPQG